MDDDTGPDPQDHWTETTEIRGASFSGTFYFACCGLDQTATGVGLTTVQCVRCHTVYGIDLSPRLLAADDYAFALGIQVRVKQVWDGIAGSTPVRLDPDSVYITTQDTHGVLNIPPEHQPILVPVRGDRGVRSLVVAVPVNLLESV